MRIGYLYSLVFVLLTCVSATITAAPATKSDTDKASIMQEISTKAMNGKVDLNVADAATLQRELSGIGEAKANAIIAYRDINGPFESVDEILEVKGIGKALLDRNREKLEVN